MRCLIPIALGLLGHCAGPRAEPLPATEDWTWERWSTALLEGAAPGELPPVPASGWTRHGDHVWLRPGAEISDYNGDGRIDYLRLVDPPGSYNHIVWVDQDHDGTFDTYPPLTGRGRAAVDLRVPEFTPSDKPGRE